MGVSDEQLRLLEREAVGCNLTADPPFQRLLAYKRRHGLRDPREDPQPGDTVESSYKKGGRKSIRRVVELHAHENEPPHALTYEHLNDTCHEATWDERICPKHGMMLRTTRAGWLGWASDGDLVPTCKLKKGPQPITFCSLEHAEHYLAEARQLAEALETRSENFDGNLENPPN
jgi:hypothetical protein